VLCRLKGQERQEVRGSAFQRYHTFSVWWAVIVRANIDKRCALQHSRNISHFLVW
ncbi:hypothetical protein K443DRAFT_117958, partial [Laccaria amethystina LaAM-08-1]